MTTDEVIRDVAAEYLESVAGILGRGRTGLLCEARQKIAYRLWSETDMTLEQIGVVLGGRDHSTISSLRNGWMRRAA